MLTREEAIDICKRNYCPCNKDKAPNQICSKCYLDIIELLKQQPEQSMREIVEISSFYIPHTKSEENMVYVKGYTGIVARCNDGTLWSKWAHADWEQIEPIPQDDDFYKYRLPK